jgi:DnaK suppressor protein
VEERQLAQVRTALEKERVIVERQLADHGADLTDDDVNLDVNEGFADSAQATAERSQLLSMIDGLRLHRREIVSALTRLDDGTFGKCERCGQQIPIERLEARPTAQLCVNCKQAAS